DTVMWCRMEAASEELGKTAITVVFLHRMSDKSLTREAPVIVPERLVEEFPHLVLSVQPAGEIDFWDDRWEAATGLKKADLVGVSSELVLDWILPMQKDRELVADLLHQGAPESREMILHVASPSGSRPFVTTWLPVMARDGRRWIVLFKAAGDPGS